jgi:hypothetical protein
MRNRMTERLFISGIIAGIIVMVVLAAPAGAVLLQSSYRGTVSALDRENATMTIQAGSLYGCSWESGTPNCAWNPRFLTEVTGRVPIEQVFSGLKPGDTVEGTILGGPGGEWMGIGVLESDQSGVLVAREIFGDPSSLPAPNLGNFSFSFTTEPDCSSCTGTVCVARSAEITIGRNGVPLRIRTLIPGETLFFDGQNDSSAVNITFLGGEALSSLCPNSSPMMGGRQAVSLFIIRITPPSTPINHTSSGGFQEGSYGFSSIPIAVRETIAPGTLENWGVNIGNLPLPDIRTGDLDPDNSPWSQLTFGQAPVLSFSFFPA